MGSIDFLVILKRMMLVYYCVFLVSAPAPGLGLGLLEFELELELE